MSRHLFSLYTAVLYREIFFVYIFLHVFRHQINAKIMTQLTVFQVQYFSFSKHISFIGKFSETLRCYLCVIIALPCHNRIHISYVPRITINFNGKIYCQIIRFSDMHTKEVGVNKINLIKNISCSTELPQLFAKCARI